MPFGKIIGCEIFPISKILIFFLILVLIEFSLIQPISPPIFAVSEILNMDALFSKPILFILSTISIYFFQYHF